MRYFIFFVVLFLPACARQMHYSDEESGRVAAFFHVDERNVRKIYASSGASWDDTIKKLIIQTTSGAKETPGEFKDRIGPETEKIKKACRLQQ